MLEPANATTVRRFSRAVTSNSKRRRRNVQNTSTIKRLCASLILLSICLCVMGFENAKKLYFVPIGDFPVSEIGGLVTHYREKFGIEIQVLPAIAASPSDFDQRRQQLIAESVIQTMLRSDPNYATDGESVLIGLTRQ